MGDVQFNPTDTTRVTTTSNTETQSIGGNYSLNDARTVQDVLNNQKPPAALDTIPVDLPKGRFMQDDTSKSINNDKDGDGIPDDYDKNKNRTVADVAAQVHKIGKYAETQQDTSEIFTTGKGAKNIRNAAIGLLDKVSETAAQSLGKIGTKKPLDNDEYTGDSRSLKKLDSMDRNPGE